MRIPLDRQSEVPLYKQIESHFRAGILSGNLSPNTRLPAIRTLAQDLGVNRITIENAYAGLEADGLIASRVGSGTYVLPLHSLPAISASRTQDTWPQWQQDLQIKDNFRVSQIPQGASIDSQRIDFSSGIGDAQLFPADEFRKVLQSVIRRDGIAALEYGDSHGYAPLRSTIAKVLASQGLQVHPDDILITSGSQRSIALVSQLLVKLGETILVESPTYARALELFDTLDFEIVGIPIDEDGMRVDLLEDLLQQHDPKLIYTIPNFQNPSGTCLSGQRRRQLIAIANRYNIPILEDDFVGDLRYEGRAQPTLKALDPGGNVIYISTFSKMLMSGLRVGFLVAEGPVFAKLAEFKYLNDLATSNLIQRALQAFVSIGRYQSHLRKSRQIYRRRRDLMMDSIKRHLPEGVTFELPLGGLFAWLKLPDQVSSLDLLPLAHQEGVTFCPGTEFFPKGLDGERFMRLNFVTSTENESREGIKRLGRALEKMSATRKLSERN